LADSSLSSPPTQQQVLAAALRKAAAALAAAVITTGTVAALPAPVSWQWVEGEVVMSFFIVLAFMPLPFPTLLPPTPHHTAGPAAC
jgi:hypothetical protein